VDRRTIRGWCTRGGFCPPCQVWDVLNANNLPSCAKLRTSSKKEATGKTDFNALFAATGYLFSKSMPYRTLHKVAWRYVPALGVGCYDLTNILEQKVHVKRVCRREDKIKFCIKFPGFVVFCVSDKGADTSNIGGLQGSFHRVFQKGRTDLSPLQVFVHQQTHQEHDRYRVLCKAFRQALRGISIVNMTDDKGIEANNRPISKPDIGRRGIGVLIGKSIANKKPVKFFVAAIKVSDGMRTVQLFKRETW